MADIFKTRSRNRQFNGSTQQWSSWSDWSEWTPRAEDWSTSFQSNNVAPITITENEYEVDLVDPSVIQTFGFAEFSVKLGGVQVFLADFNSSFPYSGSWQSLGGYYEFASIVCPNVPDGAAILTCIVVDGDDNKVAASRNFQFDSSGYVEFDFGELVPSTAHGILGYIVRAPKGFTAGSVKISEHWVGPFGSFPHVRNTYTITLTEGDKKGTDMTPHWAIGLGDNNLPVYWLGKVSINADFDELPSCLGSVVPDVGGETEEDIETEVVIPPGVEKPIVPEYPQPPVVPIPHDPIVKPEPPEPPVSGCECEVYVGLQIQRLANILVDLHNDRMSFEQDQMEYYGDHLEIIEEELSSIAQWLKDEASKLLRLEPCEPDYPEGQTITEVAKEFVDNYEPPLVEVLESEVVVNSDVDKVYSRDHF